MLIEYQLCENQTRKQPEMRVAAHGGCEEAEVVRQARSRLERHQHFQHRCRHIDLTCVEGRLILTGRVPSFYLKQVLQTALSNLEGVARIDNQVAVVSPSSLSSISTNFREAMVP